MAMLLRQARRHWLGLLPALAIWGCALARVLVDPTPHLPILFNWTPSLPYTVALMHYGHPPELQRGDFIVYAFAGDAQRRYPGLHAQPFFKQVKGVPGDRVTVTGRQVFVNGIAMGHAKPTTFDRYSLTPIAETVIPGGYYYVQGSHPDSFDSRYRESGLVHQSQVIGKVTPLF
ncbi:MAG TPA: conjugative transfer signal peptidase TraF [Oxalobacteraceae bacterium]|nr:conjugative transfer signal peptidase TraF [Oxalobacteraceae bacterium]